MSSTEVTEWLAIFMLEAEEMDAARTGKPLPRASAPAISQAELRRKVERIFGAAK